VKLQIINILGQEVCILVDEERPAGLNEATWKGKDKHDRLATSGVYFYKLETKDFVQMNKMILVR
jgi:flagellar hook assembly protein FlgD